MINLGELYKLYPFGTYAHGKVSKSYKGNDDTNVIAYSVGDLTIAILLKGERKYFLYYCLRYNVPSMNGHDYRMTREINANKFLTLTNIQIGNNELFETFKKRAILDRL